MAGEIQQPKRRGRPPKTVAQPKSGSFTFRLRPDMRERLEASAAARGISISEEIESRLELSLDTTFDPFKIAAVRMLIEQWKVIDTVTGGSLRGDELLIYGDVARKAVRDVVDLLRNPEIASKVTSEGIKNFFGDVVRRERSEIDAVLDRTDLANVADSLGEGYAEAVEGSKMMDDIMAEDPPPKLSKAEQEAEARAAADRKATFQGVSLSPEEMTEQMGPPGRQYLPPKRRPKADP